MYTELVKEPRNFNGNLQGVRAYNGFQIGTWATTPINRRIFIDADLYFQQKGHELYNPSTNTKLADNKYFYLGFSGRIGALYKGGFISIGPEVNVLISNRNVQAWNEAKMAEWGINSRLGYEFNRFKIELFYTKGLNPYEQKTWDPQEGLKTLFYGNTIGLMLGIKMKEIVQ
jgi:hypothetical protein